jgi:holo-[acyl-carrier protein] synthase
MIVGIGVDVLAVARIARELARDPHGLREQLFTSGEIAYCEGQRYPAPHYAVRFAAKEALFKALGAGEVDGASWREVEVRNEQSGQSRLILHGRLQDAAAALHADRIFVSLSHTRKWAVANVVLESSGDRAEEHHD